MPVHIKAKKGEVASSVIVTGDPDRATFIAENFLQEVRCYSQVRSEPGYTGLFNGQLVSVQSVGIGMPSERIYIHELFQLGAKKIIRVGTAGSFQKNIRVGDLVIAQGGCSDSALNLHRFGSFGQFAPLPDWSLIRQADSLLAQSGETYYVGNILGSDRFYPDCPPKNWRRPPDWELWAHYGVLGVEMETPELYTLGSELGFKALTLLTISDSLVRKERALSAKQRAHPPEALIKTALSLL